MMLTVLQVALGGAIGAVARYLVGVGASRLIGGDFPWGTFLVNIVGSFAIGFLLIFLEARGMMRIAPFVVTGILGGFTTFSAFSFDALALAGRSFLGLSAAYVGASVFFSLIAVSLGIALARALYA
jgi:CrcB protein